MRLFAFVAGLGHTSGVNFLAHLYLSEPTPASMIGNLLPDLAPGPIDRSLDPAVAAGARNHRRVDAFTDTHPVFARTRARFRDRHGRFSAILTDLFYDHVLARRWNDYHDQPLDGFIDRVHAGLTEHTALMPEPMRPIIKRMVRQGWLSCYATPDGMAKVLGMMSRRFSDRLGRSVELVSAVDDLPRIGDALAEDFHVFFPQLISYVQAPDRSERAPAEQPGARGKPIGSAVSTI